MPDDASRFPNPAALTCTPVDDSTLRRAVVLAIIFAWSDFKIPVHQEGIQVFS